MLDAEDAPSFDVLFAWAQGEDVSARVRKVAARVEADVQVLVEMYLRVSAVAQAKRRVVEAESAAAQARVDLALVQRGEAGLGLVASRSAAVSRPAAQPSSERPSAAQVRAWLRAHGHQVSERGRLAPSLWAAYEQGVDGA